MRAKNDIVFNCGNRKQLGTTKLPVIVKNTCVLYNPAVTHVRTCCLNRDDDVFTLEPGVEIVTLFLAKNLNL